jgi:hypothetical protein
VTGNGEPPPDQLFDASITAGGSATFTDTVPGTDDRTYRAVITSRTVQTVTGGNAPVHNTQTLTLASSEQ